MFSLLDALIISWFIRTTKVALFYFYLWQLKEYQIKRFLDHFRTEKGKKLFLKGLYLPKLVLIPVFFIHAALFFYLLLALYLLESLKTFAVLFQKRLKRPVLTKKTIVLIPTAIFLEVFFLYALSLPLDLSLPIIGVRAGIVFWFAFWLLIFDIFLPIIISFLVIAFQPFTVLLRNRVIRKAKRKREQFKDLLVIGVTGSYGKTSTKEFLAAILSEKFKVLKTDEHQNSEVGISQCILNNLKPEHEVFVVEMGAYGKGGIKLLCDIVGPKIGILTGINEQHLALYGSQKNIIKTKFELIESLPKNGVAIFNCDNQYCLDLYKKTEISKKLCVTDIKKAIVEDLIKSAIWPENIKVEKESISFKINTNDGDSANFRINLLGGQNIENILLAVCCAKELGMTLEEISRACLKIKPKQGAMRFLRKHGLTVLDASYSANPVGVIADLDYLKLYQGKKIVVMPCLIELGKASKAIHKKIGEKIGEMCDLAIITTKERFKEIKKEAIKKGMKKENILFIENPRKIVDKLNVFCNPEDVVLLEGRIPQEVIKLLSN